MKDIFFEIERQIVAIWKIFARRADFRKYIPSKGENSLTPERRVTETARKSPITTRARGVNEAEQCRKRKLRDIFQFNILYQTARRPAGAENRSLARTRVLSNRNLVVACFSRASTFLGKSRNGVSAFPAIVLQFYKPTGVPGTFPARGRAILQGARDIPGEISVLGYLLFLKTLLRLSFLLRRAFLAPPRVIELGANLPGAFQDLPSTTKIVEE